MRISSQSLAPFLMAAIAAITACGSPPVPDNEINTSNVSNAAIPAPISSPTVSGTPPTSAAVTGETCEGVHAMLSQQTKTRFDVKEARDFTAKAVAAAQADVAFLKRAVKGGIEVKGEAKLGQEVRAVVERNSSVTTDFFQQNQTFAQIACYFQSILAQPGLSAEDRAFFEARRRDLATNRIAYMDVISGLKKN